MKIGFSPESIVDLDGKPLVGRVTLLVHNSDTLATIYTLEGNSFVQAANPQLLDNAGRLENTLFFDAAIIDVKVERYVGSSGQMSVSSPDSDFETFDVFEIGFDLAEIGAAETVETVAQLQDVATGNKFVNVLGYYAAGDCVPRTYYWDADSENNIDGGYVVGSNVDDSGRWILLWGESMIPASVYGIVAGSNESNIQAFLSYPDYVGSFLQKTAPVARFERGIYTSNVSYSTYKEVAFDQGAKFSSAYFSLPKMRVLGRSTDYIADFDIADEAHSSWFRTAKAFWSCGSKKMVLDGSHYASSTVDEDVTVRNALIESFGRVPTTYTAGAKLILDGCKIYGHPLFNASDRVKFVGMAFRDDWFNDLPQNLDFVNNITCHTSDGNTLLLCNFGNVDTYLKAATANGDTSIDLAGRYVQSVSTEQFTEINNVVCNSLTIDVGYSSIVTLTNVKASTLGVFTSQELTLKNCEVHFEYEPYTSKVICENSKIWSNSPWSRAIEAVFTDCMITGVSFSYASDNETDDPPISFYGCNIDFSSVKAKKVTMKQCSYYNQTNAVIQIYPYNDGTNYRIDADLEGNIFDSATPVEFTKFDTVDGILQDNVYGVVANWKILDNVFSGNDEGIKCRFWSCRWSSSHPSETFLKMHYNISEVNSYVEYSGNSGKCPSESMKGLYQDSNSESGTFEAGADTLYYYSNTLRCMTNLRNSTPAFLDSKPVDRRTIVVKTGFLFWVSLFFNFDYTLSAGADNGDLFKIGQCCLSGSRLGSGEASNVI